MAKRPKIEGLRTLRTNNLSFGEIPAHSGLHQILFSLIWALQASDVQCIPWPKHGALEPNQFLLLVGLGIQGPFSGDEEEVGEDWECSGVRNAQLL